MRKLRILSILLLIVALVGFILWRFVIKLPDWVIRVDGVVMLVAIFTSVFSTVRIKMDGK
ncbi:MAG: hypothetical protein AB9835_11295 [Eubacteriales bacterium]